MPVTLSMLFYFIFTVAGKVDFVTSTLYIKTCLGIDLKQGKVLLFFNTVEKANIEYPQKN